jgi:LCP family protein required for cell wall assembly
MAGVVQGARVARPPAGRRRRRRWPYVLLVLVLLLAGFVVGGYFFLDSRLNRQAILTDYPGRPAAGAGSNWLIVGSDSRQGLSKEQQQRLATGNDAGERSDTMMLLHTGAGGTMLVSLPRDSYVPIPGHGSNKLNAAFAYGGPKLLVQTVERATGVRIDHFAEIGFGGFVGVVNDVGGIRMCIPAPMKDKKAGLDLRAGCRQLNGDQALGYVRTRATGRADLDRMDHQRQFFAALMSKATSMGTLLNPFSSVPMALDSTSGFTVDDGDHLSDLRSMMWALRGLDHGGGVTTTVPFSGFGSSASAGSYLVWDRAKAAELFEAIRTGAKVPADVITH